jgi:hypothetical protein
MAYVYRHIRLDKNEPFYIGIGNDNQGKYKRAFNNFHRNKFWKNITNKSEYRVEILFDDLTWEEACEKEIEFILLYGRKDIKKGILCNMTNGGQGNIGRITSNETRKKIGLAHKGKQVSDETRQKLSILNKGKKHSPEAIIKIAKSSKGRKASYETKIKMSKSRNGIIFTDTHKQNISKALTGRKIEFRSNEHRKKISESKIGGKSYKAIKVIDNSNGKIYDCIKDAAKDININYQTLHSYLKGRNKNKTQISYLN